MDIDAERTLPLGDHAGIRGVADDYAAAVGEAEEPLPLAGWLDRVEPQHRGVLLHRLVTVAIDAYVDRGIEDWAERLYAANPELRKELAQFNRHDASTRGHESDTPDGVLKIRCPHCRNPIEVVADADLDSVSCPSCGSDFGLANEPPTRVAEPTRSVGHFDLIERVGAGAFGEVWKAFDTKLDRTVAVKIPRRGLLDEIQQKMFLREAQNAAQLSHPRIVPVYEVGREGDSLYIVSEFVRGLTLGDWLSGQAPTAREAAEYTRQIAEALQHAHERGVIHRDLKPGNVMLDEEGNCRLMDFGLARRDAGAITMTRDGQVLGTPAYMSPEQATGDSHAADGRTDVYSLGVILFELLTGERPFRGNERMLLHQVLQDEPPSPRKLNSAVPRDLETIALKCLEKDPDRRYASAEAVGEELGRWLEGHPIEARPVPTAQRAVKWCRRNPWPAATAGVIAIALMTAAASGFAFARNQAIQRERDVSARQRAEAAQRDAETLRGLAEALRVQAEEQRQVAEARSRSRAEALQVASKAKREAESALNNAIVSRDRLKSSLELLIGLFDPTSGIRFGSREAVAEVLQQAEDLFDNGSDSDRLTQASLFAALGSSLRIDGRKSEAIEPLEDALGIRLQVLGKDDPLVEATAREVQKASAMTGRSPASLAALEERVETLRGGGPKAIKAIIAMHRLALAYARLGRISDQLAILEEAYRLANSVDVAKTHPIRVSALNNLASGLVDIGEWERAIPMQREAIDLMDQDKKWRAESRVSAIMNLGRAYREGGDFDTSIKWYEKADVGSRELLGEEHRFTLRVVNQLAIVYSKAGRFAEAIDLLNTVAESRERLFGGTHRLTLEARANLGVSHLRAKQYDEAIQILKEVLQARTESFGVYDPDTLSTVSHLATAYAGQQNYEAAMSAINEVIQGRQRALGREHPDTLDSMKSLAAIYLMADEPLRAEQLAKQLWELASKNLSETNAKLPQFKATMRLAVKAADKRRAREADPVDRSGRVGVVAASSRALVEP